MKLPPIIFCWGCPRAGSTLLQQWLLAGEGYIVRKIAETTWNHPALHHYGLISLRRIFDPDPVMFVRIFRNPADIMKSYIGAKMIVEQGLQEKIESPFPKMTGIARNSYERIIGNIQRERDNSAWQDRRDDESEYLEIIHVNYDRLGEASYRTRIVNEIVRQRDFPDKERNKRRLLDYIEDNWMKKPVRGGRLSYGIENIELPKKIIRRLNEIQKGQG